MVNTRQQSQNHRSVIRRRRRTHIYRRSRELRQRRTNGVPTPVQEDTPMTPYRQERMQRHYSEYDTQLTALMKLDDIMPNWIPESHQLPPMDVVCPYCQAMLFPDEARYSLICCSKGKVKLPPLDPLPETLRDFFTTNTADLKTHVRCYNSAFSFTSLGANFDRNLASSRNGTFTFRIQGTMYHRIGPIVPENPTDPPVYAQIYFSDTSLEEQVDRRHAIFDYLDRTTMEALQEAVITHHPYAQELLMAKEQWDRTQCADLSLKIIDHSGLDRRRYNQPSSSDVAVLIPTDEDIHFRDVVLTTRQGELQHIYDLHPAYDCLAYPLFGSNLGFQLNIPHNSHTNSNTRQRNMTIREFYAYRLHKRQGEFNMFLHGGRLFHQYVVDQYAKVEHNNMRWIRNHQKELRQELYDGIRDQLHNEGLQGPIGRRIILPSTAPGSPRNMHEHFQDAMTIVSKYGKPSLFITMTCNPQWNEILTVLEPNQSPNDRPDIIARVFNQKLKDLLHDITKKGVFGKCLAYVYVIEFQKRGLPHAHILLILQRGQNLNTTEAIDHAVSAELPDPYTQHDLYAEVVKHNLHGPCGLARTSAPCMRNGACSKHYPKEFNEATTIHEDSFPEYRRQANGRTATKGNFIYDNRWVVPYNPFLTAKYRCHINVEICATVQSVKYIYKYIYKGPDRAMIQIQDIDEIKQYTDTRYISASEACWKLFAFKMHSQSHSITRLPCHLPEKQSATFNANSNIEETIEEHRRTKLTEFFELCARDERAKDLLYKDVPDMFTWNRANKIWTIRRRNPKHQISRIYSVSPQHRERFFLRLLLQHVQGPTSFEDLRSYNDREYQTFQSAASARGLLNDDTEWETCLQEASLHCMPYQIRQIFAIILIHSSPSNPLTLFQNNIRPMGEDFIHRLSTRHREYQPNEPIIIACIAADIANYLNEHNKNWDDFNLPQVDFSLVPSDGMENHNNMTPLQEEMNYDPAIVDELASDIEKLNCDQQCAFQTIQRGIDENRNNKMYFIDGPGGHGKTFLLNAIIAHYRKNQDIVLAVSSSGISATLLFGGRTAYNRFKIPLDLSSTTTCHVSNQSHLADLLRKTTLIIWDEAPMSHRYAVEAVDRTMQDICSSNLPFGGKCILFSGDFRQTLPIIPGATAPQVIDACIKKSTLWPNVMELKLSQNMRLDPSSVNRSRFLLEIGNGNFETDPTIGNNYIQMPEQIAISESLRDLINDTFGHAIDQDTDFRNKVILAPTNYAVRQINDIITQEFPGHTTEYCSVDTIHDEHNDTTETWPTEFLNTLTPNGAPPHELSLKVGMPVVLLRNLCPSQGLCNGTRLSIKQLLPSLIEAKILNGTCKGNMVFIPRIQLNLDRARLPFVLSRRQFPIQIGFAMTINKSQGQTIEHVGVYLPSPVFSHGQLYVALSRCPTFDNLHMYIEHGPTNTHTANIVYHEILS